MFQELSILYIIIVVRRVLPWHCTSLTVFAYGEANTTACLGWWGPRQATTSRCSPPRRIARHRQCKWSPGDGPWWSCLRWHPPTGLRRAGWGATLTWGTRGTRSQGADKTTRTTGANCPWKPCWRSTPTPGAAAVGWPCHPPGGPPRPCHCWAPGRCTAKGSSCASATPCFRSRRCWDWTVARGSPRVRLCHCHRNCPCQEFPCS